MSSFFGEILKCKGLSVTRDWERTGILKGTWFEPRNPYAPMIAGLVMYKQLSVRAFMPEQAHDPTCELEASLRNLPRGTIAHIALDTMNVSVGVTETRYNSSIGNIASRPIHDLTTINLGGIATFPEFDDVQATVFIDHMTLHRPTLEQRQATPGLNRAEFIVPHASTC